jgi:hypothetical protein
MTVDFQQISSGAQLLPLAVERLSQRTFLKPEGKKLTKFVSRKTISAIISVEIGVSGKWRQNQFRAA